MFAWNEKWGFWDQHPCSSGKMSELRAFNFDAILLIVLSRLISKKIWIFISIFLGGRNSNWSRSTRDFSFSSSYYFNTASVCRWRVYTSSDLVFDKGTTKLSVGAAAACLLKEEIPPLSLKETQQTAKTWNRHPKWNRRSTSDGDEPLAYKGMGHPSGLRSNVFGTICGPTQGGCRLQGSFLKCSAPKDHRVFMTLCVVGAQTPHDEHLIWVDERSYSQESGSPFILFALLVGCKINGVGRMTK